MTSPLFPSLIPELACACFKTSLAFYVDILGFNIQYQREEEGFAMLERQGSQIMIDQIPVDPDKRSWIPALMEKPYGRGMNLQMDTVEIDVLYNKLCGEDAQIFLPLEEKWYRADTVYLGQKQFIVQDPDGYLLRFCQDSGTRSSPPE